MFKIESTKNIYRQGKSFRVVSEQDSKEDFTKGFRLINHEN